MKKHSKHLGQISKTPVSQSNISMQQKLADDAVLAQARQLHDAGQFKAAAGIYQRLLVSYPKHVGIMLLLGIAQAKMGNTEESTRLLKQAVSLKPDYAEAHYNLGVTLQKLGRHEDALTYYDKAIAADRNFGGAYYNQGLAFYHLGQYANALASFDRALPLVKYKANVYHDMSIIKLLLGEYEEGWELYEWRWQSDMMAKGKIFKQPPWLGNEPLNGRTIIVRSEQGLGDAIEFCRYVPLLERLGANVIIEVLEPLVRLTKTVSASCTVIAKDATLPQFDFQCPLMSLPLAFKTSLSDIPANVPYLFTDKENLQIWQQRLGKKSKPRIGLVWSGSRGHKHAADRSIPLEMLAPLLTYDLEYHSLQKEVRAEDAEFLSKSNIVLHDEHLIDFLDTASLVSEMDMVISIDTSVAHLAGALNKRLWVLLPFVPDWRWLTEREDSPWYPSARLFRQTTIGHWESVTEAIVEALARAFCQQDVRH